MTKKIPLYSSIMEIIKESIINGIYPIESFLPTENELEKQFNVSKITIRKAIELLENDGYVVKKSGKGTTVVSNSIFNKISKGESFSTILNKQGYQLQKEKTTYKNITIEPQEELFRYFGDSCIKITRLYYLNGHPYIHMTHYIPSDAKIEEIPNQNNFSLYMHLYRNNYILDRFDDEFYINYPPLDILRALQINEGPLLGRKRITHSKENQVIEVSYANYNTNKQHYQITYRV